MRMRPYLYALFHTRVFHTLVGYKSEDNIENEINHTDYICIMVNKSIQLLEIKLLFCFHFQNDLFFFFSWFTKHLL